MLVFVINKKPCWEFKSDGDFFHMFLFKEVIAAKIANLIHTICSIKNCSLEYDNEGVNTIKAYINKSQILVNEPIVEFKNIKTNSFGSMFSLTIHEQVLNCNGFEDQFHLLIRDFVEQIKNAHFNHTKKILSNEL